ncbi:hypothetical protein ACFZC6_01965 [Streptomyces ossamyceticus]|uniref:hypothetical protein n=1 Tax=Streptomyces ossamyceticus TaxID=249581 RepID=UPI0036E54BB2
MTTEPAAARPEVDDPRVLALAKVRQQLAYENPFNAVCPPWDGLSEQEQHLSLLDARSYLHAALKAGLVPAAVPVPPPTDQTTLRDRIAEDEQRPCPSVVDEVVAALQAKAQALSVEAEEEMRRDLEDQAQVWHEAADLARRTGRKAARNAQLTAKPETDGEGAATRFNWSDIIPAPVDETAQERDRLIDCVNRVRVALNDCKERGATGMQYEIAVLEAIGDREPRRGPGPLCHESDPRTLRECALKAKHDGDHEDGDLSWPRSAEHQPAAGVGQDGAQPQGCTCKHPADEHSVYGCADGCGCEWMPKRTVR